MSLFRLKTNDLTATSVTIIDGKTELLKAISEAIPKKCPSSVIFTVEIAKRYPADAPAEEPASE